MRNVKVILKCESGQATLVLINEFGTPVVVEGVYLRPEGSPSRWLLAGSTPLDPGQDFSINLTPILVPMFGQGATGVQKKTVKISLDLDKDSPSQRLVSRHDITLQNGAITHFSSNQTIVQLQA